MDAAPSSYYHRPPPPSHYPYYQPPPPSAQPSPPPPPPFSHSQPPPQYSHSQQLLPPLGSHYAGPPPLSHYDEVRTLFVAGLPDDCKPREIYNLFREFPGYQSSHLRSSTESSHPYAFAVFVDQQSAVAALHTLNGLVFDFEDDATLYIELAKSNSKSTKRLRTGVGSNRHISGIGNSAYSTNGYPSTQSHTSFDYATSHDVDLKKTELTQIFSKCSGFLKLKVQNKNGVPVSFVDFEDIVSSTEALDHLQGTALHTSFGEPMRLEYAKSRMGLRKRDR